MSSFNSISSPQSIEFYKNRLQKENLIWCDQVVKIIKKKRIKSLIDVGCGVMMLYKAIKKNNIKARYYGIDCDINFINIGLRKFPELKKILNKRILKKFKK